MIRQPLKGIPVLTGEKTLILWGQMTLAEGLTYPHSSVQHSDFVNRPTATEQPPHFLLGETSRKRPRKHHTHVTKDCTRLQTEHTQNEGCTKVRVIQGKMGEKASPADAGPPGEGGTC